MTVLLHFLIDGQRVSAATGCTLTAALDRAGAAASRRSLSGQPRAAFCGMGICQECAVRVDGQRRLACQTLCRDGMVVNTAAGPEHAAD